MGLVTIFGGSGFLGRFIIDALQKNGWHIRVASRSNGGPEIPHVEYVRADVTDAATVNQALSDADAAVNLTGILAPAPRQSFDAVHRLGAQNIAQGAAQMGIKRLVHLSAIGADQAAEAEYARSKGEGEQAVTTAFPNAIILRPSIIFAPGDGFFCRFDSMARFSPFLPLIGGGANLFQPVYAGDIAKMVVLALDDKLTSHIYELGGPTQYSFKQLLKYLATVTKRRRLLLPLPFAVAHGVGFAIERLDKLSGGHFPKIFLITRDQVRLLKKDNVVSQSAADQGRTLQSAGITPQSIENIVPGYLS